MTSYLVPLLAVIGLCVFWAVFQVWLTKQDPELGKRSLKCGNCGCDKQCDEDHADNSASSPRSGSPG
jgi:hypothetical protein